MTLFQLLYLRSRFRFATFYRIQAISTLSTAIGSTGAAYFMIKTSDPVRNYDRAFRSPPSPSVQLAAKVEGSDGRIQHNSVQNRCDKYSIMFTGFFGVMSVFFFPIRFWNGYPTFEKIFGFMCFGFGNGALGHWVTKNGSHDMELINWWKH